MCVYLLPEMARRGSVTDWRNVLALVLSLLIAVVSEYYYTPQVLQILGQFRIITYSHHHPTFPDYSFDPCEIQLSSSSHLIGHLSCPDSIDDDDYSSPAPAPAPAPVLAPAPAPNSYKPHILDDGVFLAKSVILGTLVLFVSTILLVLLLVSAIIVGKTVRGLLSERISVVQKESENSWEKTESKVLNSWLLSSVGQPQYFVARSVWTSAVGMIVTGFIVFSLHQGLELRSLEVFQEHHFELNWLWNATFWLQCAFVLVGWVIILWRWLMALFYFPKIYSWRSLGVENYWTRSIFEQVYMYDLHRWRLKEASEGRGISSWFTFSGLMFRLPTALKLHELLRLISGVQMAVVFFSNVCWFISYTVFKLLGFHILARLLLRTGKFFSDPRSQDTGDSDDGYGEFQKALQCLCIQGENPKSLWLANKMSVNQAKNRMKEGKDQAEKCKELIALVRHRFDHPPDGGFVDKLYTPPDVRFNPPPDVRFNPPPDGHFLPLDGYWKITAITLLNIIIKLLPFIDDQDGIKNAIAAYRQAWDLMTFVENSDVQDPNAIDLFKVLNIETDRVSIVAYQELKRLLKLYDGLLSSPKSTNVERALKDIKELSENAENLLANHNLLPMETQQSTRGCFEKIDAMDGKYCGYCQAHNVIQHRNALALSLSMYKVCKVILMGSYGNVEELVDYLHSSLGDVIAQCLLRLPNVLVKRCRNWATEFEEDKIWDAIYIAGKAEGIKDKCQVDEVGIEARV